MKGEIPLNRIESCLTRLRQAGRKALIPFLVAGDPSLPATFELAQTLLNSGADLLEIGVPFSDPSADGPHIMAANSRALAGGTRLQSVFDLMGELRAGTDAPLLLLLYFNLIFSMGIPLFFSKCKESGVDGVIVPDLPLEEMTAAQPHADQAGVLLIRMATPLSGERLPAIASNARGFVYCVAAMGVTGERKTFDTDLAKYSHQLRAATSLPRALGFGISTPEQAAQLAPDWDALIVGSAIVRRIAEWFAAGLDLLSIKEQLRVYFLSLRKALDGASQPLSDPCDPLPADFQKFAGQHRLIPVTRRLTADLVTPISLYRRFDDQKSSFLLESVVNGERWARYSIMGRKPLLQLSCRNGLVNARLGDGLPIDGLDGRDDPVAAIRQLLSQYTLPPELSQDGFRCGLVGYFAYDFVRYLEKLPDNNPDELNLPDCDLMAPGEVVLFDHLKAEITLICNVLTGDDPKADYQAAITALDQLEQDLFRQNTSQPGEAKPVSGPRLTFQSNVTREDFIRQIVKARHYIKAGDIFQVVLSQRFSADYAGDPFAVYRALRHVNPSPYLFYLRTPQAVLIGASPEMLVRLSGQTIETCPIAGTRPRGKTAQEDNAYADDLQNDAKELAEHAMLVDLARNDVGRISRFGTVKVKDFCHVERFSHVMHLVTYVEGELREDRSAINVLTSLLPAGTLSGAPKIRAMEIIDELETVRRGPYGGAVGYLGFDGRLDTCITIRTAVLKDNRIHIQAGAGIVADSVPETEFEETMNKAGAVLAAIGKAGEFL